jgi:RNA polymerase sigma-70 factor, ECF subfamily
LRDQTSSENIVQDFFVKLWEKRETLEITTSLKSYMYTSVKNLSLNYIKREDFYSSEENDDFYEENQKNPVELLEESEINKTVHQAIYELPQKCREIFMLYRFDNLSYQEIAELQDLSINTVKTQLQRAMKALTQKLSHLKILTLILFFAFMEYIRK